MKFVFDPLAALEYQDATEYYELELAGLGVVFKEEIKRALRTIQKHPNIGATETKRVRRYILHKFPFKILYTVEQTEIYIVALAHTHRSPIYWINRPHTH